MGNRIVSGGEYFSKTVLVNDDVVQKIDECSALAPLHNPMAVACIRLCHKRLPGIPQATVFDTAFHQTMPPKAYMYPLPMKYYTDYKIRKYGAHGTSHRYAASQAAHLIGRPVEDLGIITCHLGNGGSIAAVDRGESVDTTMGFTPLEGLMMGTRSGSIDPAIVTYIMRREHITYDQMDDILNRKSGLLGISGRSSDMRTILEAAAEGDRASDLAIEMYVYAIQKAIGAYYAVMTRTDAVVMTAGIGENSAELRRRIFQRLAHMGMILDDHRNQFIGGLGTDRVVSIDDSPSRSAWSPPMKSCVSPAKRLQSFQASCKPARHPDKNGIAHHGPARCNSRTTRRAFLHRPAHPHRRSRKAASRHRRRQRAGRPAPAACPR